MDYPVAIFSDPLLDVITGLRKRFNEEAPNAFPGVRIASKKDAENSYSFEVIPAIRGGNESVAGVIRDHGLSILVFANEYVEAVALTKMVCEFVQSLPALGSSIKQVSMSSPGEQIENSGPSYLFQITATIRVKAHSTKNYKILNGEK